MSAEERTEYRDGWFRLVARAKARNMVMRARQKSLGQTTETILKDLKLFGSLCIAQFIVWGTMRRNRKGTRVLTEAVNAGPQG
jgi:hypothetical protein